jgi:hypothetical protein
MQGLDNSYSCTEDFVYIGQLPIWVVRHQAIEGQTVSYDWIRPRLGGQGPEQSVRTTEWTDLWTTRLYGRFMNISWILRIRSSCYDHMLLVEAWGCRQGAIAIGWSELRVTKGCPRSCRSTHLYKQSSFLAVERYAQLNTVLHTY